MRPNNKCIKSEQKSSDDTVGISNYQNEYFSLKTVSTVRLVTEFIVVLMIITVPLSVQAGFFATLFNKTTDSTSKTPVTTVSAATVPLLAAVQHPNPTRARGGAEIVVDENALVSTGPVGRDQIAEMKSTMGEIKVHTVRPCNEEYCETISHIADMYGVTTNTILWANDITDPTSVQPGDTLVILPIVGIQHEVKKGDTISTIAKKYEGDVDEILSYNQLASASEISIGDTLLIPGGLLHTASSRSTARAAQPTHTSGSSVASASFTHPAPGSVRTQGIHGTNAVDLAGGHGSAIRAAAAGQVIISKSSGWNGGYGRYIVIKHNNGTQTLYAHLSSNSVGVGAWVSQGEVIGGMGNTGKSTGTHLHFEVRGARNPF